MTFYGRKQAAMKPPEINGNADASSDFVFKKKGLLAMVIKNVLLTHFGQLKI